MKLIHTTTETDSAEYPIPGAEGASLRILIGEADGAPNFTMLMLTLAPGGYTPYHDHPWEEQIFITAGAGKVVRKDGETPVAAGDALFIAPGEEHRFANTGEGVMTFLCMIPHWREAQT